MSFKMIVTFFIFISSIVQRRADTVKFAELFKIKQFEFNKCRRSDRIFNENLTERES